MPQTMYGGQALPDLQSFQPYAAQSQRGSPFSALAGLGDQGGSTGNGWAMPLDRGGIFGQQKWTPGNGIDIFTRRGAPVYAMFDGTVQPYGVPGPMGQIGGMLLQGDNGYTMQSVHTQMTAQGHVRKGDVIGYVGDPSMDMLGQYQGMPDGFQHLDLTIGRGRGPFPITGGDINASQWLQQNGYGSPSVGQTLGPNSHGAGAMGGGMPGMGGMGGPMGMMGGMGGGMGMPGMMGGMPGMGGMGGGMFGGGMPGGGMGMPGMGMGGFPGLGGMGGGFGGGMGMGMPGMMGGMFGGGMGMPPMMMGDYPGQGFGGFGQFGMQQGLVPGTAGVGGGPFGGLPFGPGTAMGPVTQSGGSYGGPMPNPMQGLGAMLNPLMGMGPMSPFGGGGFGGLF